MSNLLIVSQFPSERFTRAWFIFAYLYVAAVRKYFDRVDVLSGVLWVPRFLSPLRRSSGKIDACLARRDYSFENVHVHFYRYKRLGQPSGPKLLDKHLSAARKVVERQGLKFDLVHSHMSFEGAVGVCLAQEHSVPSVCTIHDQEDALRRRIAQGYEHMLRAWRETDRIICVNPFNIDELAEVAGRRDHFVYIPNGFDESRVPSERREQLRERLDLPLDRPVMVAVARWDPRKDPLILLDALHRLIESGQNPRPLLVMIGENTMKDDVRRRIEEHKLSQDVRMAGVVPPQDVMAYMRAGDMTVLDSHAEGNPTVMFESLGCGRPYIGSDVGGARTILTDERLGKLLPPKNLDALTAALAEALATDWDEQFIQSYGRKYTWDAIAEQTYEQVYGPLLEGKTTP